jgi:hypothetical protein
MSPEDWIPIERLEDMMKDDPNGQVWLFMPAANTQYQSGKLRGGKLFLIGTSFAFDHKDTPPSHFMMIVPPEGAKAP